MVFFLQWARGGKAIDVFLTAVSLAVAAIPEGLPAVVTIALALGVQRMVKRHALIRKLRSVETLGSATVICSDKTGTLTKNEMTAQAVYAGGRLFRVAGIGYAPKGDFLSDDKTVRPQDYPELMKTLRVSVLCNGAQLVQDQAAYKIVGDPTEGALLTVAAKADIWKSQEERTSPFVDELPFDSERKKMTVVRKVGGRRVAFVKGAPDVLLTDCVNMETQGSVRPLTTEDRKQIEAANNSLTDQAMRVLGVAYRDVDGHAGKLDVGSVERDLTFVGLVAMIDPPRDEVRQAMRECVTAGIKTVMITGDHKNTATAIAKQLGFFKEDSLALSGEELDKLSQEQLEKQVDRIRVYARVSPEHKLRVVRAWRARGDIVAMTGDGVNDAPAVKEADIGIAMGITGTDVTKEVSDMVVTDDNFASIVAAVEEGRHLRQYSEVRALPPLVQRGRDPGHVHQLPDRAAGAAAAHSNPVDQPRDGRLAGAGPGRGPGNPGHHAQAAATPGRTCDLAQQAQADSVARLRHLSVQLDGVLLHLLYREPLEHRAGIRRVGYL
jgi:Ca2+-transporting ATPase